MGMELRPTHLPGCFELRPRIIADERGRFVKLFQRSDYQKLGLTTEYREEYYSSSKKGVIRGLHFQLPPHDQAKAVFCIEGSAMDVAVDLRKGSPTYGKHFALTLDAQSGNGLYLPKGFAHGFCALTDSAVLFYKVETEYAPESDAGILWNSCGIDWPSASPILSARDRSFVALKDFASPFVYSA